MKDLGCHGRGPAVSAIFAGNAVTSALACGVIDSRGLNLLERVLNPDVLSPDSIFVTHFRFNSQPIREPTLLR